MFASHATRETRAIGVLLGGSGLAREPRIPVPVLPALLKPPGPATCPAPEPLAHFAQAA
jgi:hypothetical protein